MEGLISRRRFIQGIGATVATLSLPVFAGDFHAKIDSLDDMTKKMIDDVCNLSGRDVIYTPVKFEEIIVQTEVRYSDDGGVFIDKLTENYFIQYHVWNSRDEWLRIWPVCLSEDGDRFTKLGPGRWAFQDIKPLDEYSHFAYRTLDKDENRTYERKLGSPVSKHIRELFGMEGHLLKNQGKDSTGLVDILSQEVLTFSPEDFKRTTKKTPKFQREKNDIRLRYFAPQEMKRSRDTLYFEAEKNGIQIRNHSYDPRNKAVKFEIFDGKNRLAFFGHDYKDRRFLEVSVNSGYFEFTDGKPRKYPSKVYTAESVINLRNIVQQIEMYLNSLAGVTELENYTGLFEQLVAAELKKIKSTRDYKPHVTEEGGLYNIHLDSGGRDIRIIAKDGKLAEVNIDSHRFLVHNKGVDFLKSIYKEEEAVSVVVTADILYNRIK